MQFTKSLLRNVEMKIGSFSGGGGGGGSWQKFKKQTPGHIMSTMYETKIL